MTKPSCYGSRPRSVLGVDPGLTGALALLRIEDKSLSIHDMPITDGRVDPAKLAAVIDLCQSMGSIHAAVELVSSMPRQAGAFNFGVSAGVAHGVLGALGVPFALVPPNVWKSAMGLRRLPGETGAQNKTRARELAARLWPNQADLFRRIRDDGRAESAVLARFFAAKNGWL